jgi:hypothetical protein
MDKHTPGPWDIHGDNREIHQLSDEDGEFVIADIDPDNTMQDQREANARLISSAPELLAACERALIEYRYAAGLTLDDDIVTNELTAAIEKATKRKI